MLHILLGAATLLQTPEPGPGRLHFIASVAQYGPVGYRDPLGVVSPDGVWLATASETRLRVLPVVGGPMTHHNASAQVLSDGPAGTRFVWIADLLPHELAPRIAAMIEEGLAVIKRTLERRDCAGA